MDKEAIFNGAMAYCIAMGIYLTYKWYTWYRNDKRTIAIALEAKDMIMLQREQNFDIIASAIDAFDVEWRAELADTLRKRLYKAEASPEFLDDFEHYIKQDSIYAVSKAIDVVIAAEINMKGNDYES